MTAATQLISPMLLDSLPGAKREPTENLIACLAGLKPHRISVLRGATTEDIDEVGEQVNHAFNLLASYLARTLPNLNANMRSGMIAFDPALRALADIRGDLLGQISDAAYRSAEGE